MQAQTAVAWSSTIHCWNCGTPFAMDAILHQRRLNDGEAFYCPNGHANYYQDTETKRLKRELERARLATANAERQADEARKSREWAESRAKGANIAAGLAKASAKRLRARVHAGVCPDCHRTFKQLAAHMKAKH